MPIDTSIPLSVNSLTLPNPLEAAARAETIRAAQSQNKLTDYRLKSAQRKQEVQNALNDAYKDSFDPETGEINLNKLRVGLASRGIGSEIPGIEKTMAELNKEKWAGEKEFNLALGKEMGNSKVRLESIDPDSPDAPVQMLRWHRENNRMPALSRYLKTAGVDPVRSEQELIATLSQPGGAKKAYQRSALGLSKVMENHFTTMDLGDRELIMSTPKYGEGQASIVPGSEQLVGKSPNQIVAPTPIKIIDPNDPTRMVYSDAKTGRLLGDTGEEPRVGIQLSTKEIQNREAKLPVATSALQNYESRTDAVIRDLKALRNSEGLTGITGLVYGRTPGILPESRKAEALYENIMAKGVLGELTALRQSSPTGGALGNQSDREGQLLRDAFGAMAKTQDTGDMQAAIDNVITALEGSKVRMRDAYDLTYEYRSEKPKASPVPTGIAPPDVPAPVGNLPPPDLNSKISTLSPEDEAALNWANQNPGDPRAAAIRQHLGVK